MKKIEIITKVLFAILAACFVYMILRFLFSAITDVEYYFHGVKYQDFIKKTERTDVFLACIDLLLTTVLSFLMYSVSRELSLLTKKERHAKIKESAFNIYYGLVCNIEYLFDALQQGGAKYPINFEIKEDFIKHIAILSDKLPDMFIHRLYDIFFKFSGMSNNNTNQYIYMIVSTLFVTNRGLTKENYKDFFQPDFLVLYNEIYGIINNSI